MKIGKLTIVGIGPNHWENMTFSAHHAIEHVDVVVGYDRYLERIKETLKNKNISTISTGMRQETERVQKAVELVKDGYQVALLSSGDAGVYGMASLAIELADDLELQIIPGITAAISAASILGAPITLDFAVLSLSDLLVPWEKIFKRATCFAKSGVTTCFYNPVSTKRTWQFPAVLEVFKKERGDFIIGVVQYAFMENQKSWYFRLSEAPDHWVESLNMMSIVFFCDQDTVEKNGRIYVPRGYKV
ncbi:MAG: precorrin-3B C(17)-methyltransferase [Thermotogota bacterium]|nr:precorrin-3B C(17)-methyltransferase [Thermotogota bacterium]